MTDRGEQIKDDGVEFVQDYEKYTKKDKMWIRGKNYAERRNRSMLRYKIQD